eukprot:scaffold224_cov276-Chaetoceros_neogracile.AAC.26
MFNGSSYEVSNNILSGYERDKCPAKNSPTDGLKENIFVTLVCSISLSPLVIIGPPSSSKTLSLNIIDDNAKRLESPERFYRQLPPLSTYHYKCSSSSTNSEVSSMFEGDHSTSALCTSWIIGGGKGIIASFALLFGGSNPRATDVSHYFDKIPESRKCCKSPKMFSLHRRMEVWLPRSSV